MEIVGAYEAGEGLDPEYVMALIERLPDDSMLAATALADHEGLPEDWKKFLGWGLDRQIAAGGYDMTALVARAAGNWAKKPPNIPAFPRPWDKEARQKKKQESMTDAQKLDALFGAFGAMGAARL